MSFYKQCLVLTIESLVGEQNIPLKESWLDSSLILSKMKVFYKIRESENVVQFDAFEFLQKIGENKKLYILLLSEILYILNFKKKFSQKNMNRIVGNYFSIISLSIKRKINLLTIPKSIIEDQSYLTTLALCNLYTLSQFYDDENK